MKSVCIAAVAFLAGVSTVHAQYSNSGMYPNSPNSSTNQWNNKSQSQWSNQNTSANQAGVNDSTSNQSVYTQPSNIPTSITNFNTPKDSKQLGWTDDDITLNIRSAIRDDRSLSDAAKSTEVSVKNGNVYLNGAVSSEDEKSKIATIARQTQGVKSVSNNVAVTGR